MSIRYSVAILIALCSITVTRGQVINITTTNGEYVERGKNFTFTCEGSKPLVNVEVLVDGNVLSSNRLTSRVVNETTVMFSYTSVTPDDNLKKFSCRNESIRESGSLTLNVSFVMIEQDGGVESVWTEMMTNSNFILNCTVDANPNNITISGTNTSMMHDNVVFQVQNNTGVFTITKAQPSNNGNYTCTASNGLESSSITYNTFIGGAPNNTLISGIMVSSGEDDDDIVISYTITDNSTAPSRGVRIMIPNLAMEEDVFDVPIRGGPVKRSFTLSKGLNETVPNFYTIELTPYNNLGNGPANTLYEFLNGTNYTVDITTSTTNVVLLTNMTINCTSNSKYVNMSLLVNETLQHPNVIQLFNVNGTASYVFVPSKTYHNGTTFSCSGVVGDESILSSVVTISVLYAPMFAVNTNTTIWSEYAVKSNFAFNCTLSNMGNPAEGKISYTNISTTPNNVVISPGDHNVTYTVTNATIENKINFTCFANNSIGRSYSTYLVYVGGAPNSVKITPSVNVDSNDILTIDLNIIDNSNAPARSLFLTIKGIYNHTISFIGVPQTKYQIKGLVNKKTSLFGNSDHRVVITANNSIGTAVVYNKTLDIPARASSRIPAPTNVPTTKTPATSKPPTTAPTQGSNGGAIAAGIIIPIVLIILGAFIAGTIYYFYKNRKGQGFKLLTPTGDTEDAGGNYGTAT